MIKKPEWILLLLMLMTVFLILVLSIMDSVIKNKQIEQLKLSVSYLSDQYTELKKQSDKQQRLINQDFLILTQGWRE